MWEQMWERGASTRQTFRRTASELGGPLLDGSRVPACAGVAFALLRLGGPSDLLVPIALDPLRSTAAATSCWPNSQLVLDREHEVEA